MKSQFFKDTQGLDASAPRDGRISVCLLLSPDAYLRAAEAAARLGLTSSQYIEGLILHPSSHARRSGFIDGGTAVPPPSGRPESRLPPVPPVR